MLNNKGLSLRKILVVVQFAITIILIIGTIVIFKQMEYMREKSLGFNPDAIAMIGLPGDNNSKSKHHIFKEKVLQIPGVQMLSYCQAPPLSGNKNTTDFGLNGQKNNDFELRMVRADDSYFKLFDLKIIAGKIYKKSDTANGYVVNETFLRKVGIVSPMDAIGKTITASGSSLPIVGVVKDYNDSSLKESISGLAISQNKDQYWRAAIKMDSKNMLSAMKQIEVLWNESFPHGIYHAGFVKEEVGNYYEAEKVIGFLFKVFAGIIIFISFIGLFGLISFVATQRTKEIAIRKVLGASTYELIKMLNSSFLIMVFIANLVAWPLAYLFVSNWLAGFAYRIDIGFWPFGLAMLISMLITLIVVSIRSFSAVGGNTINALKYE